MRADTMTRATGAHEVCGGSNHTAGAYGHEVEAHAAFRVVSICPACAQRTDVDLCAGRVHWIRESGCRMTCPACGRSATWGAFWRSIEPLERDEREHVDDAALLAAFRDYLVSRGRATGTIDLRVRHLERLAAAHALADVEPEQIDAWIRAQQRGRRPATINSLIKSVRVFYAWADRFGVIRPNPATLLDLVPDPHRESRVIGDAEYSAALVKADPHVRAMLMLGRLAGLRLSEFTALHTDDDAGEWLVIVGKGGKQRRVPVVPELRAALDAIRPPGGGYYFPGRFDGHMHHTAVSKIIKRISGFNPHALRHAAGTAIYDATHDLRVTQAFLGHSQPNTTAIYVHVDDADITRAALAGRAAPA